MASREKNSKLQCKRATEDPGNSHARSGREVAAGKFWFLYFKVEAVRVVPVLRKEEIASMQSIYLALKEREGALGPVLITLLFQDYLVLTVDQEGLYQGFSHG